MEMEMNLDHLISLASQVRQLDRRTTRIGPCSIERLNTICPNCSMIID